jgi:hypothetical protein
MIFFVVMPILLWEEGELKLVTKPGENDKSMTKDGNQVFIIKAGRYPNARCVLGDFLHALLLDFWFLRMALKAARTVEDTVLLCRFTDVISLDKN